MSDLVDVYAEIRAQRGATKRCSACGVDHPIEAFAVKSIARRQLHSRCRDAEAAYRTGWYSQRRDRQRSSAKRSRDRRRAEVNTLIDAWLAERACAGCGATDRLMAINAERISLKTLAKQGWGIDDIRAELEHAVAWCRTWASHGGRRRGTASS